MNTQTKLRIKTGLFAGIGFAGMSALFDYSDGIDFRIWRFIINCIFFGFAMGLSIGYNPKKQTEKGKTN